MPRLAIARLWSPAYNVRHREGLGFVSPRTGGKLTLVQVLPIVSESTSLYELELYK